MPLNPPEWSPTVESVVNPGHKNYSFNEGDKYEGDLPIHYRQTEFINCNTIV